MRRRPTRHGLVGGGGVGRPRTSAPLTADAEGITGLGITTGFKPGPRTWYRCGGVQVEALVGRTDDERLVPELEGRPYGPCCNEVLSESALGR